MSIFTSLFGKNKSEEALIPVENEPKKEINENDFIDNSDPKSQDTIMISYGSSMPIDIIYQFLKEDHETKGYEDALSNPDNSYKEMNKTLIRSNLEIKFKQVTLKYKDNLNDINFHIESRSKAGLIDIVEQLKTKKTIYEDHLSSLEKMELDLQNNEGYMIAVLLSYERGFLRGLAALSLETIKNKEI